MSRLSFGKKLSSMAAISFGGAICFSGINIVKGNEKFYNNILMPTICFFPPETCHRFAILACKYKIFPAFGTEDTSSLETTFLGRKIKNPIGIAAGFDKHGEAIEGLERIGFGFIEIGSVTPEPQEGNPKPRVFRAPGDLAIINRYGFNSDGHEIVLQRLQRLREDTSFNGFLGVNLGKNKTSESALDDYVKGVNVFSPQADYLVINISSPNTPGLRNLQNKGDLIKLLSGVIAARNALPSDQKVPILLKISPDLEKQEFADIANVITKKECHVDGLIISNTTIDKSSLKNKDLSQEAGGLSGAPLTSKSTALIAEMYSLTKGKIPIIGVGGIFNGKDAFEKIEAGASVIQIYTSFIYHGPPIINKIKSELDDILKEKGYTNVSEAVGKNYRIFLKK